MCLYNKNQMHWLYNSQETSGVLFKGSAATVNTTVVSVSLGSSYGNYKLPDISCIKCLVPTENVSQHLSIQSEDVRSNITKMSL